MLTERTERAIAILCEAGGRDILRIAPIQCSIPNERARLEADLIAGGLLDNEGRLTRPLCSISLLELLMAVDEGVCPVHATKASDKLYDKYHLASYKLGAVNYLMHKLLVKVNLAEL